MSIFGKKKEQVTTYTYEELEEMVRIKGLVKDCNDVIRSDYDAAYLTHRLERIIRAQELWTGMIKNHPELESMMMFDFDELELTKKLVEIKLNNI